MKSIIIKNMELPDSCWSCPFLDDIREVGSCMFTHSVMFHVNFRNIDCPLEETEMEENEEE